LSSEKESVLQDGGLDRGDRRRGSALIMVVVLTVLLAVIGVLFVMASRIDEMATSSVVYGHELDHAVDSVVELISQRLTDDLTGAAGERAFDYPGINEQTGDNWLSTVEPADQPGRQRHAQLCRRCIHMAAGQRPDR